MKEALMELIIPWVEDENRCIDTYYKEDDKSFSVSLLEIEEFQQLITDEFTDFISLPCELYNGCIGFTEDDLENAEFM